MNEEHYWNDYLWDNENARKITCTTVIVPVADVTWNGLLPWERKTILQDDCVVTGEGKIPIRYGLSHWPSRCVSLVMTLCTSCTFCKFGTQIIASEGLQSHTTETASDAAVIITANFPVQRFDFDVFTQRIFRIRTTALIAAVRDVLIQAAAGCDAMCSGYRVLHNM
jgi:hypothetical protein